MDDLIERLQRDLIGLGSTPPPLEDLRGRFVRRTHRRRVAAGVVGVIVAVGVVLGTLAVGREADDATVPVDLGADAAADLLFLAGDGEAWVVDPTTQTVRHLSMPELPPGDAPYRVVRRGDALVAWAYRTLVLRPDANGFSSDVLVRDSLVFIPSSSPDRVWVAIVDEGQDDGRLTAVREVSIDGQVTVPDTRPPEGAWPVAAVEGDLVFQRDGELFVWDPSTGQEIDRLPGQLPVAWQGSLLVWCDGACRSLDMADIASGERLAIQPPAGATGFEALRGAFSPDGRTLAVAVRLGDGEEAGRQLALIDTDTGHTTLVPGATVPTPYVFIDWAPSGETVFITGGQHGGSRQVVEYRLGDAAANALDVQVGDFFGMAVFHGLPRSSGSP
jgi:hypothetical protein